MRREGHAPPGELHFQTLLIGGFQEPRAHGAIDFERRAADLKRLVLIEKAVDASAIIHSLTTGWRFNENNIATIPLAFRDLSVFSVVPILGPKLTAPRGVAPSRLPL